MLVVADSSPLIGLLKIGYVDVLPRLFRSVAIPQEVAAELGVIKANTWRKHASQKNLRNFIHPAQRLNEKCARATAFSAVAGMEHIVRDLS